MLTRGAPRLRSRPPGGRNRGSVRSVDSQGHSFEAGTQAADEVGRRPDPNPARLRRPSGGLIRRPTADGARLHRITQSRRHGVPPGLSGMPPAGANRDGAKVRTANASRPPSKVRPRRRRPIPSASPIPSWRAGSLSPGRLVVARVKAKRDHGHEVAGSVPAGGLVMRGGTRRRTPARDVHDRGLGAETENNARGDTSTAELRRSSRPRPWPYWSLRLG